MGNYSWVYILKCRNEQYYVGTTTRLYRRILEHINGNGSLITSNSPPIKLLALYKGKDCLNDYHIETTIMKDTAYYRYKYKKTLNVFGGGYSNKVFNPVIEKYKPSRPDCHCKFPASIVNGIYNCCKASVYDDLSEFLYNNNIWVSPSCGFYKSINEIVKPEEIIPYKRLCRRLPPQERIADCELTVVKVCTECGCDFDEFAFKKGETIDIEISDSEWKDKELDTIFINDTCQCCKNLNDPRVRLRYPIYHVGKACIRCKRNQYSPVYSKATKTKYSICKICYGNEDH